MAFFRPLPGEKSWRLFEGATIPVHLQFALAIQHAIIALFPGDHQAAIQFENDRIRNIIERDIPELIRNSSDLARDFLEPGQHAPFAPTPSVRNLLAFDECYPKNVPLITD